MLFIWRGKGYMVPVVVFGTLVVTIAATSELGLEGPIEASLAITKLVSAILIWKLHVYLTNRQPTLSIVDDETGESAPLVVKHDFYWIPLRYWSFVLGAASVYWISQAIMRVMAGG